MSRFHYIGFNEAGFTVAELLTTVTVTEILTDIAIPMVLKDAPRAKALGSNGL